MSDPEAELAADRITRNAARNQFDARLAQVRGDVDAHGGVGGKIKDDASNGLARAGRHAIDIAADNKGIVAGVVGGIALWLLRAPLLRGFKHLFGRDNAGKAGVEPEPDTDAQETDEPGNEDYKA